MSRGLILFAHGSRDPAWGTTLQTLAAAVRARDPALQVRVAFLEWQPPTLPEVIAELAAQVHSLAVCPVFWAANGHVQRDLPGLLESARGAYPHLQVELLPVLSELPGMLGFLADVLISLERRESLAQEQPQAPGQLEALTVPTMPPPRQPPLASPPPASGSARRCG